MRKLILLALMTFALPVLAQNVLTISSQQCVWRTGDDPAWSSSILDESGWQPNPHWQGLSPAAHIWVRCHADLSSLQTIRASAIQVTLYGAYQLFLNGAPLGGNGNIRSGDFSMNVIRQYPLRAGMLPSQPTTIALRITYRVFGQSPVTSALDMDPPIIHAGDLGALTALRAEVVLTDSSKLLVSAFGMSLIGVLGLALFGLFYYDRSRLDLLYLGMLCQAHAVLRVNAFCTAYQVNPSVTLHFASAAVGNALGFLMSVLFFFTLARRRVPLFYWLPVVVILARNSLSLITLLLPVDQALRLFRVTVQVFDSTSLVNIAAVATATASFVAFWPYSQIARRMRPLAALCLLMGTADLVWFVVNATNNPNLGLPNLLRSWHYELLEIRGAVTACVLIFLLVLLFRDQRQVTEERALLAGEIQAASEIQRMLAPDSLESAPGLKIEVAFHPMREVGGDFYLCRVLQDGRQRVLIGDVSGKGSAAAMTAALLLGAAAGRDADSPADLLAHLNRILMEARVGGFATCLCADVTADGNISLANAGHLAPYTRGEEIYTPASLPLGLDPRTSNYELIELPFPAGDTLTFLSDGVVEARSKAGELFGFERARNVSAQPASEIAEAALNFGQEDDITVLTITRVKNHERSSAKASTPILATA
jgi:hypothetical protein